MRASVRASARQEHACVPIPVSRQARVCVRITYPEARPFSDSHAVLLYVRIWDDASTIGASIINSDHHWREGYRCCRFGPLSEPV